MKESRYTTPPSIGNYCALGMLNDPVVSFCSLPSFWHFRGRNVPRSRQGRPRRQATTQAEQAQRAALLDRRSDQMEMKMLLWQRREVDLQTLPLCKPWRGRPGTLSFRLRQYLSTVLGYRSANCFKGVRVGTKSKNLRENQDHRLNQRVLLLQTSRHLQGAHRVRPRSTRTTSAVERRSL